MYVNLFDELCSEERILRFRAAHPVVVDRYVTYAAADREHAGLRLQVPGQLLNTVNLVGVVDLAATSSVNKQFVGRAAEAEIARGEAIGAEELKRLMEQRMRAEQRDE